MQCDGQDTPSKCLLYASLSRDTVYQHRSGTKLGVPCNDTSVTGPKVVRCPVQSFSTDIGLQLFFRIDGATEPVNKQRHPRKPLDPSEILHEQMAKMMDTEEHHHPEIDNRAVHVFLVESGIHDPLCQFPADYLREIVKMPPVFGKCTNRCLKRLYQVVGSTVCIDYLRVRRGDNALGHAIANCAPYVF